MSITIEPYSEWSIVVRGDTNAFKKHLADIGGTWAPKLTKGGPGWIFKKKDKEGVEKLRSDIDSGKISPSEDNEESAVSDRSSSSRPAAASSSSSSSSSGDWVPMKTYLALLARVERLEAICSHSPFADSSSKVVKSGPKEIEFDDADDADVAEEENDKAVTGLLRKKKVAKKTVMKKAKE